MNLLGTYSSPGMVNLFETILESMGYMSPVCTIQIAHGKIFFSSCLPFSHHETVVRVGGETDAGPPVGDHPRSFTVSIQTLLKVLKPLKAFKKKRCTLTISFFANLAENQRDTTYHMQFDFNMVGNSSASTYTKRDTVCIEPGVYLPQPVEVEASVAAGMAGRHVSMLPSTYAKFCKDLMSFPSKVLATTVTSRRLMFGLADATQNKKNVSFFYLSVPGEDEESREEVELASFNVNKLHVCKLSKLCGSSFATSVTLFPGENSIIICCDSRVVDMVGRSVIVSNALHNENSSVGNVRMNITDVSSCDEDDGDDDASDS